MNAAAPPPNPHSQAQQVFLVYPPSLSWSGTSPPPPSLLLLLLAEIFVVYKSSDCPLTYTNFAIV